MWRKPSFFRQAAGLQNVGIILFDFQEGQFGVSQKSLDDGLRSTLTDF
jgi:hypothetical protein